jgi:hypothetical protein
MKQEKKNLDKGKKAKQTGTNISNLVKSLELATCETMDLRPTKKFIVNQSKNINFKNLSKQKNS